MLYKEMNLLLTVQLALACVLTTSHAASIRLNVKFHQIHHGFKKELQKTSSGN